jgi:hypothetical protein
MANAARCSLDLQPLVFLAAFAPIFLLACSDTPSDEGSVGVSEGALGEPETSGFKTPSLALEDELRVFAGYTHLDPQRLVPDNLLYDTVAYFDANKARLGNKSYITVVDFSKHSGKRRMFVVNMKSGSVTPHMVAHGAGSEDGNGYAKKFSDVDGSHQSSLGFVVTGDTYYWDAHGRSLLLHGLSNTNGHMRSREIVVHSADYVSETSSRQGNSWGCFAVDPDIKEEFIDQIKEGSLLYANLGKPNTGTRPGSSTPAPVNTPPANSPPPAAPPPSTPNLEAAECTKDGDCNPGSDGSGQICVAGACVAGCNQDNQCPGSTSCIDGMCQ